MGVQQPGVQFMPSEDDSDEYDDENQVIDTAQQPAKKIGFWGEVTKNKWVGLAGNKKKPIRPDSA